jgi:anti-sigma B factor antagonist
MEMVVHTSGPTARLKLEGPVDETGAEKIKTKIQALDFTQVRELVFDFQGVDHIGSAGIGQLLLAYKNMATEGGTIRAENLSPHLYELFTSLKIDTLFKISC